MNSIRTRATFAASVLALTAALAGCGGEDTLTAKEFRSQAEKLCSAAEKDTDALGAKLTADSSEAEVTKAIDGLVDRTDELADDLATLKAPESLADDVDAMIESVRAALKKIDGATVAELGTMQDPFTDANDKAKALKIDACGR